MEKGTRAFVSYVRGYREHQVCIPACHCHERLSSQCWSDGAMGVQKEPQHFMNSWLYTGVHAAIKAWTLNGIVLLCLHYA